MLVHGAELHHIRAVVIGVRGVLHVDFKVVGRGVGRLQHDDGAMICTIDINHGAFQDLGIGDAIRVADGEGQQEIFVLRGLNFGGVQLKRSIIHRFDVQRESELCGVAQIVGQAHGKRFVARDFGLRGVGPHVPIVGQCAQLRSHAHGDSGSGYESICGVCDVEFEDPRFVFVDGNRRQVLLAFQKGECAAFQGLVVGGQRDAEGVVDF